MSNLSTIVNDNQGNIKGAAFHYKFYAILLLIAAGLMIILGIPLLLLFGLGIIYIGIGVLYIFVALNLIRASNAAKSLISSPELTQDEYNTGSMNVINETRKFFKMINIIFGTMLALGLIAGIVFAATLPSLINEIQKGKFDMMDTPYQTQSNKSLTAQQMGMTDKEHSEMHDPKFIENTDYSKLDYSDTNTAGSDIKKAQEATTKAMEKMTPEQKAAIDKMMEELKK
jgi:hypothetical protein